MKERAEKISHAIQCLSIAIRETIKGGGEDTIRLYLTMAEDSIKDIKDTFSPVDED